MNTVRWRLVFLAVFLCCFAWIGLSHAFHSGGVADCVGCHEMHSATGPSLLKASDISSTCLICHASADTVPTGYHVMTYPTPADGTPPVEMTPGGDFGWLKKNYYFTVRGAANTDLGQSRAHNIIAADMGYTVDTDNPIAPGGTFNSNNLACNSCHDQHGKIRRLSNGAFALTGAPIIDSGSYNNSPTPTTGQAVGAYRLLRGLGQSVGGVTFNGNPPVAVTPSEYNRSEFYTQTRTAYGMGMSDFCGVCHPEMHTTAGILRHPTNRRMSGTTINNYNYYVKSGSMTGSSANSYLSLVPFEEDGTTPNYTTLKAHAQNNDSYLNGPSALSQVMCLTCHRAHASGFPEMTNWCNEGEFIVYNGAYPGTDATPSVPQFSRGRSQAETAAAYYNRNVAKFATYQRSLCNKCHAKD